MGLKVARPVTRVIFDTLLASFAAVHKAIEKGMS